MSSTAGPSSNPTASQKKEKKQKNASAQNPSKPPQEKKKTSNTQSVNEATSVTEKKAVFRPVLDNPLKIEWPNIPLNVENNILALVVQLLETVRPYHEQRSEMARKGKNSRRAHNYKPKTGGRIDKKGKTVQVSEEGSVVGETTGEDGPHSLPSLLVSDFLFLLEAATVLTRKRKRGTPAEEEGDESGEESVLPPSKKRKPEEEPELQTGTAPLAPARPEMLDHVVFGLNAVTKRLEAQSFGRRSAPNSILPSASAASGAPHTSQIAHSEGDQLEKVAPLRLVLVCRTDIDSPTMIAHLPTLTAACNSVRLPRTEKQQSIPDVLLVGLPSGAESTLAESSGLRRAAVIAFDAETPELEERLAPFLLSVPILQAHWLTIAPPATAPGGTLNHSTAQVQLLPTHVKHLKTTAPKDAKAAKQKRVEEVQKVKATKRSYHATSGAAVRNRSLADADKADGMFDRAEEVGAPTGTVRSGFDAAVSSDKDVQASEPKAKRRKEKKPTATARPSKRLEKVVIRARGSVVEHVG